MRILLVCLLTLTTALLGAATAPVAKSATVSAVEGTATISIYLEATDAENDALTYEVTVPPVQGTLAYTYPQSIAQYPIYTRYQTYTCKSGFIGTDTFKFVAKDAALTSNTATITIKITANVTPVARDQKVFAYKDAATSRSLLFTDPDVQTRTFTIVTQPAHGTLTQTSVNSPTVTYTPAAGYTGPDSFTWKVADPFGTSAPATCRIQVRDPASRMGDVVEVIANQTLYGELAAEIDRLKADLIAEGYTARITTFPGTATVSQVWTHLKTQYDRNDQWLAGTILIGSLPKPKVDNKTYTTYTDLVYWNMDELQTVGGVTKYHIWASRIIADGSSYGSEATLIRRALDANHAYRTGRSRLPHKAYVYDSFSIKDNYADKMLEVWPTVAALAEASDQDSKMEFLGRTDIDEAGADAFVAGGEILDETSHGKPGSYMMGRFGTGDLFRLIAQQRVGLIESCTSGAFNGIVNHHIFTRGGGLMWAVGGTETNYVGDFGLASANANRTAVRARLAQGETWGRAILNSYPFYAQNRTVYYGDLSMPVKISPANELPVVSTFTATPSSIQPGQTVTFNLAFADADASSSDSPHAAYEHRVEWFATGYDSGRAAPSSTIDLTGATTASYTHTFATAGKYTARVEVVDEWQGRGWKEVTVTVNRPPVAVADSATTVVDTAVTIAVLANDSDPDGQTLTLDSISTAPQHGTAAKSGTQVIYTPAAGYTGSDTFVYKIKDSIGTSATATVTVTVNAGTNAAPVAQDQAQTLAEDGSKALVLTATDADGDPLTWTIVDAPAHGTLTGTAPNLTYAPAANWNGTDTFTCKASDGMAQSNLATVTLTVTPVNDAPVANAGVDFTATKSVAKALAGSGSDVDGDPLTYAWSTVSGPGTVTFANAASPTSNATFAATGSYVLKLVVGDGTVTVEDSVAVTVVAANQAPTVNAGTDRSIVLPATAILAGSGSDPDGDALIFAWTKTAGPGTVVFSDAADPTATATYRVEGVYDLRLTVSDGKGGSANDTVRITVQVPLRRIVLGLFSGTPATALDGFDIWMDGCPCGILQADGSLRFDTTAKTVDHTAVIIEATGGDG